VTLLLHLDPRVEDDTTPIDSRFPGSYRRQVEKQHKFE